MNSKNCTGPLERLKHHDSPKRERERERGRRRISPATGNEGPTLERLIPRLEPSIHHLGGGHLPSHQGPTSSHLELDGPSNYR